jgi:nicotinate-nucleotide adenylyltransferase
MQQLAVGARRIAFFGGSFDPPHLGHLAVARAARAALGLDTVLFAPVGAQPLKPQGSTATFEDRLAMTRLAIAHEPGFMISLADAPRSTGDPNYTLETLLRLRAELPPGGTLYFLMGADSFLNLRHWHRAAEIPFAANLIVASRPGERLNDLADALPPQLTIEAEQDDTEKDGSEQDRAANAAAIAVRRFRIRNRAGESAPFFLLDGLHVEISATEIRQQVRELREGGMEHPGSIPAAVADYIRARGLYL